MGSLKVHKSDFQSNSQYEKSCHWGHAKVKGAWDILWYAKYVLF